MVRKDLAALLGVPDLLYPDRRIAKFAKSKNIPLIPLAHHLQNYAETNNAQLHGHKGFAGGHWNETGHRIAGERLAEVLCAAQEPS